MPLIESWLTGLHDLLQEESLTVTDVRIGIFYTGVQLSSGQGGVAFTPRGLTETVCCPRSAAEAPPAGHLAGQDAWTLAQYALSPVPLRRAVGVAVLNALSALAMRRQGIPGGKGYPGMDALAAAQVQPADRVALVGAFIPFIKTLKGKVAALWVVDTHREALKDDELPFWRPPEEAPAVLAQASVVVITGSALV
ncbi:MAG: Fis family transcriptional regulator, partial [Nitrospinota bacterium]